MPHPLAELPRSSVALRSQKVCDFEPVAVSEIRIKSPGQKFLLKKESNDWVQKEPSEEKADVVAVAALLKHLDSLQTSEFLDPQKVRDPKLNPPLVTIQLRETRVGRTAKTSATTSSCSTSISAVWTHARKVFYAQLDGRWGRSGDSGQNRGSAAQECDGVPRSIDHDSVPGDGAETRRHPRRANR